MNHPHSTRLLTLSLLCLGAHVFAEEAKLPEIKVDTTPLPSTAASYAPMIERVAPCVVTISTSRDVRLRDNQYFNELRRYFGIPDDEESGRAPQRRGDQGAGKKQKQMMGIGSGVVVSAEGHILTNNHVIDGADEIVVTIGNEKHEYKAKKIGGDPDADLAVLKIEDAKVQPIVFTDSDQVRVGDVVLAIGNPFGLTRSVSSGIVSSIGRGNFRMATFENYIQTDASINPGNSGGALVDVQGRLVGINTIIFSRSGGNEGIGFAVPSNLARAAVESLIKHGRVIRGFLGIVLQDVTEEQANKFKVGTDSGAAVNEVQPNSPGQKAGIRIEDIITSVNGKKIDSPRELILAIGSLPPATKVDLKVLREGKEQQIEAVLGERPASATLAGEPQRPDPDPDVLDGVQVTDLTAESRKEFKVPAEVKGVLIEKVAADSPSADAGLKQGDVILEIEREAVTSAKQAVDMSEKLKKQKKVLLRVSTKGETRFMIVERKE